MRFKLELNGKKYESASFADRHFFSFMAAFSNTSGLTLREMLNEQFAETYPSADQFTGGMLKSYPSLEDAEKDLKYLFEKIFPTIEVGPDDLCVEEFMGIIGQMGSAYAASKNADAQAPTEIKQKTLTQPPDIELSDTENNAVTEAAKELGTERTIVDCWYQWWKALDEADEDKLPVNDALEVIIDVSKNDFDLDETLTFHKTISRILKPA